MKSKTSRLKHIREKSKLSMKDFAEKYHIGYGTYRHWEEGIRTPPEYVVYMLEQLEKKN